MEFWSWKAYIWILNAFLTRHVMTSVNLVNLHEVDNIYVTGFAHGIQWDKREALGTLQNAIQNDNVKVKSCSGLLT